MAAQTLSIDREFRYIIMWFSEFSELQREDFVPILVEYLTNKPTTTTNGVVHMNGLVNAVGNVGINNKPMSLFQCRMKLFREWSIKWPLDFQQKLQEKIVEIDPKVGENIINEIKSHNSILSNGNAESDETVVEAVTGTVTDDILNAAMSIVNATEEAIMSDNRLSAMLNNETSVDDDDNDAGNDNDAQINVVHVIEPAGQVQTPVLQQQTQPQQQQETVTAAQAPSVAEHTIVIPAQSIINSAEVPLVA